MEKDIKINDLPNYITILDGEKWSKIKDFEEYYISDLGRIFSLYHKKLIKPYASSRQPYLYVKLIKDKQKHIIRLNRLVAQTFLPNPENKNYVHHINCAANDDRACNLQWVTFAEHIAIHRQIREKKKRECAA